VNLAAGSCATQSPRPALEIHRCSSRHAPDSAAPRRAVVRPGGRPGRLGDLRPPDVERFWLWHPRSQRDLAAALPRQPPRHPARRGLRPRLIDACAHRYWAFGRGPGATARLPGAPLPVLPVRRRPARGPATLFVRYAACSHSSPAGRSPACPGVRADHARWVDRRRAAAHEMRDRAASSLRWLELGEDGAGTERQPTGGASTRPGQRGHGVGPRPPRWPRRAACRLPTRVRPPGAPGVRPRGGVRGAEVIGSGPEPMTSPAAQGNS
jgi:hypothetical protein